MGALLGTFLAWLRLASGSLWPGILARDAKAVAHRACLFFLPARGLASRSDALAISHLIPLAFWAVLAIRAFSSAALTSLSPKAVESR